MSVIGVLLSAESTATGERVLLWCGGEREACIHNYMEFIVLLSFHRPIIEVLLFDCGQTEVATIYLDSPGRTLYRTFGARVIRHSH